MNKQIKDGLDKEGRVALKRFLGIRLSAIYEREKSRSQSSAGMKELTLSDVAEKCLCSQRTVERMVSCVGPLPRIYNLYMFYDALNVSQDEQADIQNEITSFVRMYIEERYITSIF